MKQWIVASGLAVAALAFSIDALAQVHSPRVDARQAAQAHRIHHGVASGALTPRETANLVHQQRHIRVTERRFERDGHLGRHERRVLEGMQNTASRRIYRKKHNARRW